MKLFSTRNLHLWHRWLGIALGIMVLLWFISGVVMLFVAYPKLTQEERIPRLEAVTLNLVKVMPAQLGSILHGEPDKIRLTMQQGRPIYHALHQDTWHSIWADNGAQLVITSDNIQATAQAFHPESPISDTSLLQRDLWSISSSLHIHRPLHRVSFANGDMLYLSSNTGEVVLDTTRSERAWNWLGSVIHWIYITPLRAEHSPIWRQLILWISLPATIMSLIGMWLGIQRLRLRRRYKGGRVTPYRGWAKWHHISGLVAGVLCVTWLFSGWISMNPLDLFSGRRINPDSMQAWAGKFPSSQLPALPAQLSTTEKVGEIEWIYFADKPYLLGHTANKSLLFNAHNGHSLPAFNEQVLIAQAEKMIPGSKVIAATWLTHGDHYYYGKRLIVSPVIRIDLNDAAATSHYIDPATSRIVASSNNNSRGYRWLFSALHRLDVTPLDNRDIPRWIVVILFSIGGIILTMAGMVMGWRRITRA